MYSKAGGSFEHWWGGEAGGELTVRHICANRVLEDMNRTTSTLLSTGSERQSRIKVLWEHFSHFWREIHQGLVRLYSTCMLYGIDAKYIWNWYTSKLRTRYAFLKPTERHVWKRTQNWHCVDYGSTVPVLDSIPFGAMLEIHLYIPIDVFQTSSEQDMLF